MNSEEILKKDQLLDYELYYLMGEMMGILTKNENAHFEFSHAVRFHYTHWKITTEIFDKLRGADLLNEEDRHKLLLMMDKIIPSLKVMEPQYQTDDIENYKRLAFIQGILQTRHCTLSQSEKENTKS